MDIEKTKIAMSILLTHVIDNKLFVHYIKTQNRQIVIYKRTNM